MNWLRKSLVWLRSEYLHNRRQLLIRLGLLNGLMIAMDFAVDVFLPMDGAWTFLRSALLIPTAIGIFSALYILSLFLHFRKVYSGEPWIPYRSRFSPSWRRRIALIMGVVIIVLAQAVTRGVGYTYTSSILASFVVALLAFIRTTKEESKREELGVPDSRDVIYDAQKRRAERERLADRQVKKSKRTKFIKG